MSRAARFAVRRGQSGFTLLSVLVAIMIFGIGLLGMVRAMVGVTSAGTQNQTVSALASLSNGFWGVVQANPNIVVDSTFANTFTSSTIASAPAALQPWLTQATTALPSGTVAVATSGDSASGAACTVANGCSVTLTMSWTQVGAPGGNAAAATRTQVFYYQFGL